MTGKIIELSFLRLFIAYVFLFALISLLSFRRIKRERELLYAMLRMTLQLVFAAYVLVFIFKNASPFYTVFAVVFMEVFAIRNIYKRVRFPLNPPLRKTIALSMGLGSSISLIFFIFFVIGVTPWYEPRYIIPISGMIIGNSMTGISLGVFKLLEGLTTEKESVEAALMLGATPETASRSVVHSAFDAALLPMINNMMGMGIVFLPGLMSGQILAGASPLVSIRYQLVIMLAITGSVILTVLIFIRLALKNLFNQAAQPLF
ncbi:MAG: ABC transporter permease [Elusimicrobia bacterium]|nr:ABC transporter permease [Elusimicrobiota bacterium]